MGSEKVNPLLSYAAACGHAENAVREKIGKHHSTTDFWRAPVGHSGAFDDAQTHSIVDSAVTKPRFEAREFEAREFEARARKKLASLPQAPT